MDDDGHAKRQPWELWLGGEDDETSAWMRATSPSGAAAYEGRIVWSSELGVRVPPAGAGPAAEEGRLMAEFVIFFIMAAVALGAAISMVLARNPVHAALLLVTVLIAIAVMFLLQDAQLLAAVQIIVYAGAIVVLFLFVIMLLGVDKHESLARSGALTSASRRSCSG